MYFTRLFLLRPQHHNQFNNAGPLRVLVADNQSQQNDGAVIINDTVNLGNVYHTLDRFSDAVTCYQRAIEWKPDRAVTFFNLAGSLRQVNRLDEAKSCIQHALQLDGNYARAFMRYGDILSDQRLFDEAVSAYQKSIALGLKDSRLFIACGIALRRLGKLEEAVSTYNAALAIEANSSDALTNLGNAYSDQGKIADSIACHRRAIAIKPSSALAWSNLGQSLQQNGELDEALDCYQQAISLDSNCSKARFNRSLVLLSKGDLEIGFQEYEWRWIDSFPARDFARPIWDGKQNNGKTILLHAEQGLGDTIQFIRYAEWVQSFGMHRVIVECQPALLPLLKGVRGIDVLIPRGESLPHFDTHAPLMSLPRILRTKLHSIPCKTPYLEANPDLVMHWKKVFEPILEFRVGIVWQGNVSHPKDKIRSIPLRHFEGLSRQPGLKLVSLQKGFGTEQLAEVGFRTLDFSGKMDELLGPLMDTAAVLKNLDLVIACDSAIAHLAGALGVPTWILLNTQPDWRWMLDRNDTPWYPSVRLFRQLQPNDWGEVFSRVEKTLKQDVEKQRLENNRLGRYDT